MGFEGRGFTKKPPLLVNCCLQSASLNESEPCGSVSQTCSWLAEENPSRPTRDFGQTPGTRS